jgi:serine/threonine protein kinase
VVSDALTGRTLDEKYHLESRLGEGGMGVVYRARRVLIGDTVAVKVLHGKQVADPKAVERFRREAQTAARLKHPNVVRVYDFGVSKEGLNYLVLELVEGESLRRLIEQHGTLTEAQAGEIIPPVCAALDEAHSQGVVHRDIKPENILVETRPGGIQVKVLDFGIAALRDVTAGRLTQTGGTMGTLHYMSPEHCLGEKLDGRADIYSLGVVLFEMLTGVLPFDSHTPTAIAIKQVNQPAPAPRTINPNISPAVETVVLRALEKDRNARPQTAGDLARELTAAITGIGTDSAPHAMNSPPADIPPARPTIPSPREVVMPPLRSTMTTLDDVGAVFGEPSAKTEASPVKALLILGALLLLLIVVALWWYSRKDGDTKAQTTGDAAGISQQASKVSGQPGTPEGRGTVSPSTPQAGAQSVPGSNLWAVISDQTNGVVDAAKALGTSNQQFAVIKQGGQLALDYREGQFFGNGEGADLRVYGPETARVSYLIFVRDSPAEAWRRIDINRKGFPQGAVGHDMGHHGLIRARQVMIRNNGNTDLNIDAISAIYKDKAPVPTGAHQPH